MAKPMGLPRAGAQAIAEELRPGFRSTIAGVDVYVLDIPLTFKRSVSKGAVSDGAGDPWRGNPVMVRIRDSEGRCGFGRLRPVNPIYGETTESMLAAIHRYYAPLLLGADPLTVPTIIDRLEAVLPHNPNAVAIVDMALLDLASRQIGVPLYTLLGGVPAPIPLDWSVSLGSVDTMVAEATNAVARYGIRMLSLKVGPSDRWREDVETFKAIRSAVGNEIEIAIDANESFDSVSAVRIVEAMNDDGLAYFEQPLDRHDLEELAALRRRITVPVMLDESVHTRQDAYRAVRAGAADCVVLKVGKCGGITRCLQMAAALEAASVSYAVGGVAHGNLLEAAAYAHLWTALPRPRFAAEFILGLGVVDPDAIARSAGGLAIDHGTVAPPTDVGLGVQVDMSAVAEHSLASHSLD